MKLWIGIAFSEPHPGIVGQVPGEDTRVYHFHQKPSRMTLTFFCIAVDVFVITDYLFFSHVTLKQLLTGHVQSFKQAKLD